MIKEQTEQTRAAVTLYTCMRKVMGSNIDLDTGCPDLSISWFCSVPPANAAVVPPSEKDCFIPNPFHLDTGFRMYWTLDFRNYKQLQHGHYSIRPKSNYGYIYLLCSHLPMSCNGFRKCWFCLLLQSFSSYWLTTGFCQHQWHKSVLSSGCNTSGQTRGKAASDSTIVVASQRGSVYRLVA
jgi:hypothetical protein